MDYAQFEKLLTNAKIIQTTLSDAPSNLYDGATSYESKRANAVDNYGLSKKLKAVYGTTPPSSPTDATIYPYP